MKEMKEMKDMKEMKEIEGRKDRNVTLELLKNRKSMRVFEEKPIPQEMKEEILNAAFQAPTAGAMMLYTILDITDQELKEKLAVTCDNQPFIAKSPLVLIFLADFQRWYDSFSYAGCEPRLPAEGDLLLACADAVIAAQNSAVAAEALGLGSCYIGDIVENAETVREILNLPEYAVPAAMLVYGYPAEAQLKRKKPARYDREYIVQENRYRRFSSEEHTEMHRRREEQEGRPAKDLTEMLKAFCNRKYMSEFSLEMSRSTRKYLEPFAKSVLFPSDKE